MAYIEKLEHNKVLDLKKIVPIEEEQMLSRTFVQRDDLGIIIFSLDKGQEIGRHSSLGDAMANVLPGIARITTADDDHIVKAGESIVVPAEVPHALHAEEAFQILLIVVKSEVEHD